MSFCLPPDDIEPLSNEGLLVLVLRACPDAVRPVIVYEDAAPQLDQGFGLARLLRALAEP